MKFFRAVTEVIAYALLLKTIKRHLVDTYLPFPLYLYIFFLIIYVNFNLCQSISTFVPVLALIITFSSLTPSSYTRYLEHNHL